MTSQENFTPNSNLIICPQHGQEYASKVCTYINCDKYNNFILFKKNFNV